ncbi:hypothetical protein HaLaN_18407 [Haematococcus lacustris]|uniref:Uncharacterized protein n=1 Tax=Haematococcus lacustris TaxID=44745 RepID=A0A699ZEY7_HAELA|nr:hypothetical protein HaLaN_18407 [Haematococcus lacustris]
MHQAMSKRGAAGSLLVSLGREFTPELGVYSASKRGSSRAEQWARGLPLAPLR